MTDEILALARMMLLQGSLEQAKACQELIGALAVEASAPGDQSRDEVIVDAR